MGQWVADLPKRSEYDEEPLFDAFGEQLGWLPAGFSEVFNRHRREVHERRIAEQKPDQVRVDK